MSLEVVVAMGDWARGQLESQQWGEAESATSGKSVETQTSPRSDGDGSGGEEWDQEMEGGEEGVVLPTLSGRVVSARRTPAGEARGRCALPHCRHIYLRRHTG